MRECRTFLTRWSKRGSSSPTWTSGSPTPRNLSTRGWGSINVRNKAIAAKPGVTRRGRPEPSPCAGMILALEPLSEELLAGGDVPLAAKQEIDAVSLFVDSAVKIRPTASDFAVV